MYSPLFILDCLSYSSRVFLQYIPTNIDCWICLLTKNMRKHLKRNVPNLYKRTILNEKNTFFVLFRFVIFRFVTFPFVIFRFVTFRFVIFRFNKDLFNICYCKCSNLTKYISSYDKLCILRVNSPSN